jgi:UDP-N-acetylmuramoyl-tripeptide--D-alanyl-D-alanine ligase
MISASLKDIASHLGAQLKGEDRAFHGVSTDSRTVTEGQLYVALRGERHDGHAYVSEAMAAGAVACVVERPCDLNCSQLIVGDCRRALGDLARYWRDRFDLPVIAVTGSNGKTTVKEMITSIMGQKHSVLATRGNLNNDIGVPLTLFNLSGDHQAAIIEMGANHAGEIDYLASIARPVVAVVNNAGPAHLEGFGSLIGVARAKGELFTRLGPRGTAIVNHDDEFYGLWMELVGERKAFSFGMHPKADFRAQCESKSQGEGETFLLLAPCGQRQVKLALAGRHNVLNALAAAAACHAAGAGLEDIVAGLEAVSPVSGRLQFLPGVGGAGICDDTYNANPLSLKAALEVLVGLPGTPWLVLGDMGELGPDAQRLHREAGRLASELGVQRLFGLGSLSAAAVEGFGSGAQHFDNIEDLLAHLLPQVGKEHRVLVKGSRAMRMERVVQALVGSAPDSVKTGS